MTKIKIEFIEKIENGYICEYIIYYETNNIHVKNIPVEKRIKTFINSPLQLGRLILRNLDEISIKEDKENGKN